MTVGYYVDLKRAKKLSDILLVANFNQIKYRKYMHEKHEYLEFLHYWADWMIRLLSNSLLKQDPFFLAREITL